MISCIVKGENEDYFSMNALPSIIYDPNARVNSCTSDGLLVVIYRQVFEALEAVLLENEVPPPRVLEAEPVGADEVEPPR